MPDSLSATLVFLSILHKNIRLDSASTNYAIFALEISDVMDNFIPYHIQRDRNKNDFWVGVPTCQ